MTSNTKTSTAPTHPRQCTTTTPIGPFTVVAADLGGIPTVLASGWTGDAGDLLPLIAADLRPARPEPVAAIEGITDAIAAYHDGELSAIDAVPVRQHSGPFLQRAWQVLRTVPPGAPVTYTEYAALAGSPRAVRAAGSACSRNAAALFVPCHRVLPRAGVAGGVGSFRWGVDAKRWLLAHEGA